MKNKIHCRNLDEQAKVFSLASSKKYSSIFRLSVILKEKIEANFLEKAVILALEKYKAYKVKMKRGFFWYYLEHNSKTPIIKQENDFPFKKLGNKENNDYLFKVTYFNNKINLEIYHILTDGNSGADFLKEIVYRYLELKYPEKLETIELAKNEVLYDSENAYMNVFKKSCKNPNATKRAYLLQGETLEKGQIGIKHFNINLNEIKNCTKTKAASISMFIIAMIGYSIYETNYKENNGKKPINICVPINLKKYFTTETISNFFSYMIITLRFKKNKKYNFDNILEMVKKQFEIKLKLETIIATMSSAVGMTNNAFIRKVPLYLKKFFVRLGSLEMKRHFTMTVSNIGKLDIDKKYSEFVEKFFVILSPDWAEKIKCGICSYGDNLVVTFGSRLKDAFIENRFKNLLIENNINFKIEKNQIQAI